MWGTLLEAVKLFLTLIFTTDWIAQEELRPVARGILWRAIFVFVGFTFSLGVLLGSLDADDRYLQLLTGHVVEKEVNDLRDELQTEIVEGNGALGSSIDARLTPLESKTSEVVTRMEKEAVGYGLVVDRLAAREDAVARAQGEISAKLERIEYLAAQVEASLKEMDRRDLREAQYIDRFHQIESELLELTHKVRSQKPKRYRAEYVVLTEAYSKEIGDTGITVQVTKINENGLEGLTINSREKCAPFENVGLLNGAKREIDCDGYSLRLTVLDTKQSLFRNDKARLHVEYVNDNQDVAFTSPLLRAISSN